MSGHADEWATVQERVRTMADRVQAHAPTEPVELRSVLDVAFQVAADEPPGVLAGIVAVLPTAYDGETRGEFAARLREAVAE